MEEQKLQWIYMKAFILLEKIVYQYDEKTQSSEKLIADRIIEAKELVKKWEEMRNVFISKTN